MTFRIYTKTGDKGETSLIGGTRVPKNHLRIECYGTVDELNSYIGLVIDTLKNKSASAVLYEIQDRLFTLGSVLASDPVKAEKNAGKPGIKIPDIHESDIQLLETEMDNMDTRLPELKNFVLPGGTLVASHCHVARCICRRAERLAVALQANEQVPEIIIRYLNRLSDYLFMFARASVHDSGASEITWKPRV